MWKKSTEWADGKNDAGGRGLGSGDGAEAGFGWLARQRRVMKRGWGSLECLAVELGVLTRRHEDTKGRNPKSFAPWCLGVRPKTLPDQMEEMIPVAVGRGLGSGDGAEAGFGWLARQRRVMKRGCVGCLESWALELGVLTRRHEDTKGRNPKSFVPWCLGVRPKKPYPIRWKK